MKHQFKFQKHTLLVKYDCSEPAVRFQPVIFGDRRLINKVCRRLAERELGKDYLNPVQVHQFREN